MLAQPLVLSPGSSYSPWSHANLGSARVIKHEVAADMTTTTMFGIVSALSRGTNSPEDLDGLEPASH